MATVVSEAWPVASTRRVLVVDDEPPLLCGLKIVLRGAGYVVESVRSAGDGLRLVATQLDSALPDGEGVEVCRELRRLSGVPILLMSAVGAGRDERPAGVGYRLAAPPEGLR